ncbi:MAG: aldose 1-epimerase [Ruminococcus sp.]|nr:aldose 1-epimerase [Ruminococcus sp.]
MNANTEITDFKGFEAVKLCVGDAFAVVVPELGSNVVRFRDEHSGVEVFRYNEKVSGSDMNLQREVWGLPSLYLPNRFGKGLLRTSDALYKLPINETSVGNHIHGFLHLRSHTVKSLGVIKEQETAFVETEYVYDKNDDFYSHFPVDFICNIRVELRYKKGAPRLYHYIKLINISAKRLPVSLCTHTAINAPFTDGGNEENIRLMMPIDTRIDIDRTNWLPSGKPNLPLSDYDFKYKSGSMCPVLHDICNEMYTLEKPTEQRNAVVITDNASGKKIINILSDAYKFIIVWNDGGGKGYFCPEPMTAQINAPNLDISPIESGYAELEPNGEYTAGQCFVIA